MRIAIIGYGRMGQLIEQLALEAGDEIVYRISSSNSSQMDKLAHVDVAIEFTHPEVAVENFGKLSAQNIPIVTGTTGWMDEFETVEKMMKSRNNRFFYASNFSVGVHLTMAINRYMARLFENYPEYALHLEEWHHTGKKDAPSGTAISLAGEIIKNNKNYSGYAFEKTVLEQDEFQMSAYREGDIPGTHQIKYESRIDSILLRHAAKNRNGFAQGALKAARFLLDQDPGIYTMNDLIKLPL